MTTALLLGVPLAMPVLAAEPWPSRPIKLVVPTGPGSATDIIARLIADALSKKLEKPMIVDNKAGASGIPAHQAVARAEPDGYTLLFTNTSGMASNLVTFKELVNLGVGHTLHGTDDATAEGLGDGLARVIEFDQGGHDQAVLLRH